MAKNCRFCDFKENYLIIKDYKYWTLVLAESQYILGRTIAFLKRHIRFFEELTDEESLEIKQIVGEIKSALNKTFKPDWFNVMQLGNLVPHLHIHMVPRYKKVRKYDGRIFVDKDYGKMITNEWEPEDKNFLTRLTNHIKDNI